MSSIGSYLGQLFAIICIFLGCMNTYFFVSDVPEKTTIPQYFSGIALSLWPVGLGVIILLLMEIWHQLNLVRIAAQDRAYTSTNPTPTTPILRAEPAPAAKAPLFAAKQKEEKAPVYFAINTPPPAPRPEPTPQPQEEEAPTDMQQEPPTDESAETIETISPTERPERPKDPSLNFFKLD